MLTLTDDASRHIVRHINISSANDVTKMKTLNKVQKLIVISQHADEL